MWCARRSTTSVGLSHRRTEAERTILVDGDPRLGLVVLLAMWGNQIVAGFAGAFVPATLDRMGVDPSVASSVFVHTLTDLCGFALLISPIRAWVRRRLAEALKKRTVVIHRGPPDDIIDVEATVTDPLLGSITVSDSESEFAFGVGFDFLIGEKFALRGEYESFEFDVISFGGVYRF